ncbi:MAG TPA: DUF6801 domain-containing protein, partial [Nocardioidaceae bacterium]|nr:DUF6801 domain-containing protein [Nocardioidaceae bacterium]
AIAAGLLTAGLANVIVSAPAEAADVPVELETTYACTGTLLGSGEFTGKLAFEMPTSVPSASIVPARPVTISFTIPDAVLDGKRPPIVNSIAGTASGLHYRVGAMNVPVANATIGSTAIPADGPLTIETETTANAFQAQGPGTYAVKVPLSFTVAATAQTLIGPQNDTINCSLKSGAPDLLGNLEVTPIVKKASATSATVLNKPITTAKRAKVLVKVTAAGEVPTGTVKAKLGRKLLKTGTLTAGKVRLLLPKLPAGDKKVKFIYSGNLTVKPSSKVIVIRVKKA